MPRKMNWIELLFSRLPIGREKLKEQILVRLGFLFLIWFTGLVAHALDGMTAEYVSNVQTYMTLFGTSLIVFFGSYMVQRSLGNTILSFRSLLRLDDSSFKEFSERVERYGYSFVPCILIALLLTFFFSVPGWQLSELQAELFRSIHAIWNLLFVFFLNLLTATGVWIGVSIWLTIFLISKQPLQVKPSPNTIEEFRGLTMLALWFSLFYFLAISIGIVVPLARQPAVSLLDILFSPLLVFIAIGVIIVLSPFYNIHKALLSLKKSELLKIEEEFEQLQLRLDGVLEKPVSQSSDEITAIMGRLSSLQIKERRIKLAQEWPIDVSFLSKLLGLVLVPAIIRALIEILNRLYL